MLIDFGAMALASRLHFFHILAKVDACQNGERVCPDDLNHARSLISSPQASRHASELISTVLCLKKEMRDGRRASLPKKM
jgi:hypothetical protein